MFEELTKMAEAGADFTIKNKYGKRSQELVNEKLTSSKEDDEEEKSKLLTLKGTIVSKQQQIRQLSNQTESSDGSMQMKQSSNDGSMQRFSTWGTRTLLGMPEVHTGYVGGEKKTIMHSK
jgi:hypothetical protein